MTTASAVKPRLRLYERFFIAIAKGITSDGVWIGACGDFKGNSPEITKVMAALALIKQSDRLRYRRITTDLQRIWIGPLLGNAAGCFRPEAMMCELDGRFVLGAEVEFLASVIVHEANHARLWRREIGYAEAIRYRVERACMRQEIAFAQKLPDNEALLESIGQRMALTADFWNTPVMIERINDSMIPKAKEAGMPDWAIKACFGVAWAASRIRSIRGKLRSRRHGLPA